MNDNKATPRIFIFYSLADTYARLIRERVPDADIVTVNDMKDEVAFRQHIVDESCNTFTTFRARLDETSRTPTKGFHEIRSATLG